MNNDNASSCEFGIAVKRRREEEGDTTDTTDRLSHLPDFIIHHILSFLETKSAVQTSVLSRSWRSAWKHVPVLNLPSCFREYSSFQRFVDNVLSLRHRFKLREMTFDLNHRHEGDYDDEERDLSFIAKVAEYALTHDTQHLAFHLVCTRGYEDIYLFSKLFGTVSNCSIKTLELSGISIDSGFGSSSFQMLNRLELAGCMLASDQNGVCDPFSNCPLLESLFLCDCESDFTRPQSCLNIFGPRLLKLYLHVAWFSRVEISAPRLKTFDLCYHAWKELESFKLTCPSLDRVVIFTSFEFNSMEVSEELFVAQCLISLFQGLSNVTTLRLDPGTIKVLSRVDAEFLEQQSSPFTRLKTLIVDAEEIPYVPLTYLLEGSSVTEPTIEFVPRDTRCYCHWEIL